MIEKIKSINKSNWRMQAGEPSLIEVHRSVPLSWRIDGRPSQQPNIFRKLLAFMGPGYLVAVGYMDPGNWATALSGGAKFGYTLLVVALLSNMMAIILQALAIRLGVVSGRDLARACRDGFSKIFSIPLWVMAELAIVATDLAEVIGTAIALNLLFQIPLTYGVIITALDVFLILWLQSKGFRLIESMIVGFLIVIGFCFGLQLILADPNWGGVLGGFVPRTEIISNPDMLYISLGILGATVMPHNLYLHSAIVQTRAFSLSPKGKKQAIKYATIDSTLALSLALLVNASIIILAAAVFHRGGQTELVGIEHAHELLEPMLGTDLAPLLFGVALLACGLSSTITATMAGQVVMEGFLGWRLKPWLRRLITRGLAIIPAAAVAILFGTAGTSKLLILSQVVLSLQLPFAIVPLVLFTSNRKKMGQFVSPRWLMLTASIIGAVVIILNIKVIIDFIIGAG
ncbi:MAG: Nramp family divalent metal transporter [Alphaproteobacteria bacterium]